MPPTDQTHSSFKCSAANHKRRLTKLRRRAHPERLSPPRQNLPDHGPGALAGVSADSETIPLETPPIVLHASITPLSTPTATSTVSDVSPDSSIQQVIPTFELVLIITGAAFAGLFCLCAIIVLARKPILITRALRCFRRKPRPQKKALILEKSKGNLAAPVDSYDDLTWGTSPTRIIRCRNSFEIDDDRDRLDPLTQSDSGRSLSSSTRHEADPSISRERVIFNSNNRGFPKDGNFRERVQFEEEDIASALSLALRDIVSHDNPVDLLKDGATASRVSSVTLDTFSLAARNEQNISPFESLRAGLNGLGKHASVFGFKNRPRQGSDASASSQDTSGTNASDIPRCFSSDNSSRSSITSFHSSESGSDEDGLEGTYELKRAQTQSLEIKKGVLIAWECTSVLSEEETQPLKVIISEPCPSTLPFGATDEVSGPDTPLSNSKCLGSSPSVSSLVREYSHGTLASLETSFSSTTRAEGWGANVDGHLQPPIPYLMVTRPSTSSIFTTGSSESGISVDLNDFPHPPSLAQPSCGPQLSLPVPDGLKRIWDNHSIDSTMEQKRSTVEQFITMYAV